MLRRCYASESATSSRSTLALSLCCLCVGVLASTARADIGIRDFADTILTDDPEPNDQFVGPTVTWQRFGTTEEGSPTSQIDLGFEIEKRITPRLSIQLGYGGSIVTIPGDSARGGFQNLSLGLQYEIFRSAPHEFIVSLGVAREFGNTGSTRVGAEQTGTTTPLVFVGKGFGDLLPISFLRPLALTGEFGYAFADKVLKGPLSTADDRTSVAGADSNGGLEHRWVGGFTLQYPLGYLDNELLSRHFPEWLDNITPLVEFVWSSPATSPSNTRTQWIIAPGIIWSNQWCQFGVEALIPGNGASGKGIGMIAQFRMALGVIAPALNRPIFGRP